MNGPRARRAENVGFLTVTTTDSTYAALRAAQAYPKKKNTPTAPRLTAWWRKVKTMAIDLDRLFDEDSMRINFKIFDFAVSLDAVLNDFRAWGKLQIKAREGTGDNHDSNR